MVAKCTRRGVHFRVWEICLRNALCEIVGLQGQIRLQFDVSQNVASRKNSASVVNSSSSNVPSNCRFAPSSSDPVMWKRVFEKCLRLQVEKGPRMLTHGLQARSLACKTAICFSGAVVLKQRVF